MSASNIKPIEPVECPTLEKSEEQAFYLQLANQWIFQLDENYLLTVARMTREQAGTYDAAAVLNRKWNEHHSQVLRAQADALEHIAKYIAANKRVSFFKEREDKHHELADELTKLFI